MSSLILSLYASVKKMSTLSQKDVSPDKRSMLYHRAGVEIFNTRAHNVSPDFASCNVVIFLDVINSG